MNRASEKDIIQIRNAKNSDIESIYNLLSFYAEKELLLKLSKEDVQERLSAFIVAVDNDITIACAAIRDFGDNLFEVRSLAVDPKYIGQNIGTDLVEYIMNALRKESKVRLFALTYSVHFFKRLGFLHVDKELFPQKIWSDCSKCPKQDNCDEEALMIEL